MKIVKGIFCKDVVGYDEFVSGRKLVFGENRGRVCCG